MGPSLTEKFAMKERGIIYNEMPPGWSPYRPAAQKKEILNEFLKEAEWCDLIIDTPNLFSNTMYRYEIE